jgi:uncharacterized membrane protein YedE/YeeE
MTSFLSAILGGALMGSAAGLLYLLRGRVAGIGGIFGGAIAAHTPDGRAGRAHRLWFLLGLLLAGFVVARISPPSFGQQGAPLVVVGLAGLLVGFGMQRGSGCTSGHGICGLGRLSTRSLLATLTFMATGAVTVLVTHHWLGGSR